MPDLNAMVLFARVVEQGSFSGAARLLGLPTSRLSRAVSDLEAELGVRLLNRTTRRMSLTAIGSSYYPHCAALAAQAEAAGDVIEQTRSAPIGLIRISCPVPLLAAGVSGVLTRYLATWPDVRLHVEATGRRINLVEEGFDIAVRVRPLPLEDTGETIRPLARTTTWLVGPPRLLADRPVPGHPDDLVGLPTLSMTSTQERHTWSLTSPAGETVGFVHRPRLMTDDFQSLRQAALDGSGIAQLPNYLVQDDVESGRLLHLLPQWGSTHGLVHAAFATRRGLVPAVRLLLDALVEAFAGRDLQA